MKWNESSLVDAEKMQPQCMRDNTVYVTFNFYQVFSRYFRNFDIVDIDFNKKLAHGKHRKKFIARARDWIQIYILDSFIILFRVILGRNKCS